jgi:hypothetical protein
MFTDLPSRSDLLSPHRTIAWGAVELRSARTIAAGPSRASGELGGG